MSPTHTMPDVGAMMNEDTIDTVSKALRRAWQLGQTYWQQADSDSYKQQDKSYDTQKKFEALVGEIRALLSASKPAVPEGWKLVPVKATDEMIHAVILPGPGYRFKRPGLETAYKLMVAASPAAPTAQSAKTVSLTDEQMMAAIKSVCGFDAEKAEQWRPEALSIGRAVERASRAASAAPTAQAAVPQDERGACEVELEKSPWTCQTEARNAFRNGWDAGRAFSSRAASTAANVAAAAPAKSVEPVTHEIGGRAVCRVEAPAGFSVECVSEGAGITKVVVRAAPQPAQTAVVLDDGRAALRRLFEAAFNAGWDRSDECDNAYNNGTSEQLSVPPKAQEPPIFQEWRAQYFSDRSEVVESLLARAASPQAIGDAPDNAEPPRHIIDAAMDVAHNEYGHGVTRASIIAIWKALGKPWYVPQVTETQPVAQTERALTDELLVDLFYAAQSDITKFRIKARALLTAAHCASGGE